MRTVVISMLRQETKSSNFSFISILVDKKEILPILRNDYHNKDNDMDNEITYGIVETNELLNSEEKPNLESGDLTVYFTVGYVVL